MTAAGAKAVAKSLEDHSANPPVFVKVHPNGPKHESVVHVTYGEPKVVTKEDKNGQTTTSMPKRPKAHTIS
jgi:hypothetical protein